MTNLLLRNGLKCQDWEQQLRKFLCEKWNGSICDLIGEMRGVSSQFMVRNKVQFIMNSKYRQEVELFEKQSTN